MKKIMLFFIISFCFIDCFALSYGGCEYSVVSRMKSIVKNINISYDYSIIDNEPKFSVTINNITPDIYFFDTVTNKNYYYGDTNNGEITIYNYNNGGTYKFYSNNSSCYGLSLGNKYYKFPQYNIYYTDPLCADIPNYSLCQKWTSVNYSREEFEEMVIEYKTVYEDVEEVPDIEYEKTFIDKLVELYINYYYYFLGGIIITLTPIIIVSSRKNRFKL